MSEKLKLCPFCASEAVSDQFTPNQWFIYCLDCCSESGHWDCEAEAIAAWNRRTSVNQKGSRFAKELKDES